MRSEVGGRKAGQLWGQLARLRTLRQGRYRRCDVPGIQKNGFKLLHYFRGSRQRASGAALGSQDVLALSSQANIERIPRRTEALLMGVVANQAANAQALVAHLI